MSNNRLTESNSKYYWPSPLLITLILIILLAAFLRLSQLPALPPGLNFDEAGNGVAALDILQGKPKLWWRIGGGKEPLWPYLLALSTALLGNRPLALRLPAALTGILTVAAVYPLMLTLFKGRRGRAIALLTALGLALSGWHLHFSRLGFRAILLPLLSTLAFYFFWRGFVRLMVHKPSAIDLVLSSLFMALALYAYLAARLLPLVPLLFFACCWFIYAVRRWRGQTFWPGVAKAQADLPPVSLAHPGASDLLFGVSPANGFAYSLLHPLAHLLLLCFAFLILFLAPLIIYFLLNPADFVARSTTVSIFAPAWNHGDLIGAAWRTTMATFGTFIGLKGDANPLANLPGQPALPLILAPFFIVGLAAGLYGSIRLLIWPRSLPVSALPRLPASSHLFLLCWWAVMLLPAILAPEGAPHHLRLLGAIVPTYALVAVGLVTAGNFIVKRLPVSGRHGRNLAAIYLLAAVCYSLVAFQTYANYFNRWPATVDFTLPFDRYAVRLAADIAQAPPDTAYVLPMDIRAGAEARHYTLDYLLANPLRPAAYTYIPVDERNAEMLLSRAASGKNQLRLVRWTADKHRQADAKEIITYLLETQARFLSRESFPVYDVETYALTSPAAFTLPAINQPIGVTFEGLLRIDAAFVPASAVPGGWLPAALTVAPLAPMAVDYKASLRLVGPGGQRVAQKDRSLMHNYHQGTSLWPPETVNEYYLLPLPPETPAGLYSVVVVIYHPQTQAPLVADGVVEVPLGPVRIN